MEGKKLGNSMLLYGDCLEVLRSIPSRSVHMVLADPPYETTQCEFDVLIPFEPLWQQLKRICRYDAAICLFGNEPFSSAQRMSNPKMYKYDWYWNTVNKLSNHLNAHKQPMRQIETISVFYDSQCRYVPQKREGSYKIRKKSYVQAEHYGKMDNGGYDYGAEVNGLMPVNNIFFDGRNTSKKSQFHPTQKPIELLEYMLNTYSIAGEMILDFCAGGFSTGVACQNLNRKFIGIEKKKQYFDVGVKRMSNNLKGGQK